MGIFEGSEGIWWVGVVRFEILGGFKVEVGDDLS